MFSIQITADNAYELYVNGIYIGGDGAMSKDGPDNFEWNLIETYDISSALQTGENTILIRAINYFSWGGNFAGNPCGLVFRVTITSIPIPELPLGAIMATVAGFAAIGVRELRLRRHNKT